MGPSLMTGTSRNHFGVHIDRDITSSPTSVDPDPLLGDPPIGTTTADPPSPRPSTVTSPTDPSSLEEGPSSTSSLTPVPRLRSPPKDGSVLHELSSYTPPPSSDGPTNTLR